MNAHNIHSSFHIIYQIKKIVYKASVIFIFLYAIPLFMRLKQSIIEDYFEADNTMFRDIPEPVQKYIHFWDFVKLDFAVHEFQAKMEIAIRTLKKDISERYKDHFTRTLIQTPDKFISHNRDLMEIEYMLENPFFLAVLHFALTKKIDEKKLRVQAVECKRRLSEKRQYLRENLRKEISSQSDFLIK